MAPTPPRTAFPPKTVHRLGTIVFAFSIFLAAVVDFAAGGRAWAVAAVVAAVIGCSSRHGGRLASPTCTAMGSALVSAGVAHLLLMAAERNPSGLRPIEVITGLTLGLFLCILGTYGRAGLLRRVNNGVAHSSMAARRLDEHPLSGHHQELLRAEMAMAEGHPTPEQELMLIADGSKAHRARRHTPARIPRR